MQVGYRKVKNCWSCLIQAINKQITTVFKFCFPALRVLIGLLNAIFILLGILMLVVASVMYIVPSYHIFVDSLKYIFNIHTIFGASIILGFVTTIIGILGIYFLYKGEYDKLGLQGSTFLVLLIIMSALVFTFWTEWEANSHFGISFATQSFNPYKKTSRYFNKIQSFLKCCGSLGPTDYDIGNEFFKKSTVPLSCCNLEQFPTVCQKNKTSKSITEADTSYWVYSKYSYRTGCMSRMETIIWPSVIYGIAIHGILSTLCMLLTAATISGYHACIKIHCNHKEIESTRPYENLENINELNDANNAVDIELINSY